MLEPQLVRIEGGWLNMGSVDGRDDERPVHRVWVDSFSLGATPVTNAEYGEFVRCVGGSAPPQWDDPSFNDPLQPVVAVSWFDAVSYCQWVRGESGRGYRLPCEAEWELAARDRLDGRCFPWGDEPPQSRPRYEMSWRNGPEPVRRTQSSNGLYDMCENVHEWCSDWYAADYYAVSAERNPRGPESGTRRVSRGGSWRHQVKISRCAARSSIPPGLRYSDYGFRVACD